MVEISLEKLYMAVVPHGKNELIVVICTEYVVFAIVTHYGSY